MSTFTLLFEPLDLLVFRDHRPFDAGVHNDAQARMPSPRTLYGCVRAALLEAAGADFAAGGHFGVPQWTPWLGDAGAPGSLRIRGPVFVRGLHTSPEPLFVTPLDGHRPNRVLRSELPQLSFVGGALQEALPWPKKPWAAAKPKRAGKELLTPSGLASWREGGVCAKERKVPLHEVMAVEPILGIARDPDSRSVAENMLYNVQGLRFNAGCGLAVELDAEGEPVGLLRSLHGRTVALGGKGHRARMHLRDGGLLPGLSPVQGAWRALLLTPMVPPAGGPLLPAGASLTTLVTKRAVPEGGFDLRRRRPHPLRAVLPAGTILEGGGPAPTANHTWGQDPELYNAGYGVFVTGGISP